MSPGMCEGDPRVSLSSFGDGMLAGAQGAHAAHTVRCTGCALSNPGIVVVAGARLDFQGGPG